MSVTVTAYGLDEPGRDDVAGFRVLGKPGVFVIPREQLKTRPLIIGRDDACDLRVRHKTVSERHCELVMSAEGATVLSCLGSKNGVKLGERGQHSEFHQISWHPLQVGDHIRLGNVTLVVVDPDGRCPLTIEDHAELVRHAVQVYGSEREAATYLGLSVDELRSALAPEEDS